MKVLVDSGCSAQLCDEKTELVNVRKVPGIEVEAAFGHKSVSKKVGDLINVMLEKNVIFEIKNISICPLIQGVILSTRT